MREKSTTVVQYPENRRFMSVLRYGDREKLAKKAGTTVYNVRIIVQGKRRMTDKLAKAIVRLLAEREKLQNKLEQAAKGRG